MIRIIAVYMLAAGLALAYFFKYLNELKEKRYLIELPEEEIMEEPEGLPEQEFMEEPEGLPEEEIMEEPEGLPEQEFMEKLEEPPEQEFEEEEEEFEEADEDLDEEMKKNSILKDRFELIMIWINQFIDTTLKFDTLPGKIVDDLLLDIKGEMRHLEYLEFLTDSSKNSEPFPVSINYHEISWEELPLNPTYRAKFLIYKIDEFRYLQDLFNNPEKSISILHSRLFLR